jgi:hypothetical protein
MLRQTSTAVGFAVLLGMCALQGCSSGSTNAAGSGSTPTAGSGSGSPVATSGSPAANSGSSPATSQSTTAPAASPSYSKPVAIPTKTSGGSGSSGSGSGGTSGSFTAPAVTSSVKGWGTYQKTGAGLVHVQVCAQKTGSANAVGVEVVAYNSADSKSGAIASVILPQTPGQEGCEQTTLFDTAHLKVYSFIGGANGTITQQSAMKSIY